MKDGLLPLTRLTSQPSVLSCRLYPAYFVWIRLKPMECSQSIALTPLHQPFSCYYDNFSSTWHSKLISSTMRCHQQVWCPQFLVFCCSSFFRHSYCRLSPLQLVFVSLFFNMIIYPYHHDLHHYFIYIDCHSHVTTTLNIFIIVILTSLAYQKERWVRKKILRCNSTIVSEHTVSSPFKVRKHT